MNLEQLPEVVKFETLDVRQLIIYYLLSKV